MLQSVRNLESESDSSYNNLDFQQTQQITAGNTNQLSSQQSYQNYSALTEEVFQDQINQDPEPDSEPDNQSVWSQIKPLSILSDHQFLKPDSESDLDPDSQSVWSQIKPLSILSDQQFSDQSSERTDLSPDEIQSNLGLEQQKQQSQISFNRGRSGQGTVFNSIPSHLQTQSTKISNKISQEQQNFQRGSDHTISEKFQIQSISCQKRLYEEKQSLVSDQIKQGNGGEQNQVYFNNRMEKSVNRIRVNSGEKQPFQKRSKKEKLQQKTKYAKNKESYQNFKQKQEVINELVNVMFKKKKKQSQLNKLELQKKQKIKKQSILIKKEKCKSQFETFKKNEGLTLVNNFGIQKGIVSNQVHYKVMD